MKKTKQKKIRRRSGRKNHANSFGSLSKISRNVISQKRNPKINVWAGTTTSLCTTGSMYCCC
jgi:glutaminase